MIAQTVENSQTKWDKFLPELVFAYNTAHCKSTGYTPAYLNFGRELQSPGSTLRQAAPASEESAKDRISKPHAAIELARIKIAQNFQKQQKYYNLRRREWRPKLGDPVLKKAHELSDKSASFNAKLAPKYEGPYTVYRIRSPVIYDLKTDDHTKNLLRVHVRDLKPYHV